MMVGGQSLRPITDRRPWTFYALGGLFAAYLLFLYGPMCVIYVLSFKVDNGGFTFTLVCFRVTAVLFGSFVVVHWLARSPRNIWTLLYELVGLSVLLFLLAAATGGLRRSRW